MCKTEKNFGGVAACVDYRVANGHTSNDCQFQTMLKRHLDQNFFAQVSLKKF